jgi:predicted SprT family Zn-dependent metalloprotease
MENKPKNKCQYNYPNCQQQAQFQHIVKLGSVKIDKKWACGNCKQILQNNQK